MGRYCIWSKASPKELQITVKVPFFQKTRKYSWDSCSGAPGAYLMRALPFYTEIVTMSAAIMINIFLLFIILGVQSFFLNGSLLPARPSSIWKQVYSDIRIYPTIGIGY